MADTAASVLARLKKKANKVEEVISFACNCFARKNFCDDWRNLNMRRISF